MRPVWFESCARALPHARVGATAVRLGGTEAAQWEDASFVVARDAKLPVVRAIMQEALVFSVSFVVQCIAQERIVNAGPYILHADADDQSNDMDDSDLQALLALASPDVAAPSSVAKRRATKARAATRQMAAAGTPDSSAKKAPPQRRARTVDVARETGRPSKAQKRALSPSLSTMSSSAEQQPASIARRTKERVRASTGRRRSVAQAPPNTSKRQSRGGARHLRNVGTAAVLDALVDEFADFTPNQNGCFVSTREFRE